MSISAIRRNFTRQKFQAFLDAQPARKLAGNRGDCNTCPLAVYLGKQSNHVEVEVFSHSWRTKGTRQIKNLPKWAENFIAKVDVSLTGKITYGSCAKILRSL